MNQKPNIIKYLTSDTTPNSSDFKEPDSVESARKRIEQLVTEKQTIELHLGDRNKTVNNQRLDSIEYHTWRKKAKSAKFYREREISFLKSWIKDKLNLYSEFQVPETTDAYSTIKLKKLSAFLQVILTTKEISSLITLLLEESTPNR